MASKYFWSFNCFQFVNAFQIKQILEKKKKNDLLLKTFNKKRSNSLMINPTKVDFEKIPSDLAVWIVGSDHEEAVPREQTDTMASWIPQAGELILPGTSHFALIQEPTRFTAALEQFLAEATNMTICSNYRFVCINN